MTKEVVLSLADTYEKTLVGAGVERLDSAGAMVMGALKQAVCDIPASSFNSDPTLLGLVVRAATDLVAALRVRIRTSPDFLTFPRAPCMVQPTSRLGHGDALTIIHPPAV